MWLLWQKVTLKFITKWAYEGPFEAIHSRSKASIYLNTIKLLNELCFLYTQNNTIHVVISVNTDNKTKSFPERSGVNSCVYVPLSHGPHTYNMYTKHFGESCFKTDYLRYRTGKTLPIIFENTLITFLHAKQMKLLLNDELFYPCRYRAQ